MNVEVFIPLTQGKVAVIDFEDFDKVRPFKWHARKNKKGRIEAARNSSDRKTIRMHREILGVDDEREVDHKNGDALDNHRINLRVCTPTQNSQNTRLRVNNTSGFKGVRRHLTSSGWQAYLQKNNPKKFFHLGIFLTSEEAARAYDREALKHFGEFAKLNFPVTEQ